MKKTETMLNQVELYLSKLQASEYKRGNVYEVNNENFSQVRIHQVMWAENKGYYYYIDFKSVKTNRFKGSTKRYTQAELETLLQK